MTINKNRLIIVGSLLGLFVLFIVGFFALRQSSNQQTQQAPEIGGPATVQIIDKDKALYNATVLDDYIAVRDRLTDYVAQQKGDTRGEVEIIEVNAPTGQGTDNTKITFRVNIKSLSQQNLLVEFDYAAQPFATFTIKEKGFEVPLYGGQD